MLRTKKYGSVKILRRDDIRIALFAVIAIIAFFSSPVAASTAPQLVNIGGAFQDVGKYQEALNAYNNAIEIDPANSYAWSGKGLALKDMGKYQEALEAFNKALELNPDNLDALLHKGYSLIELGRRQEAIAIAQEVINKSDRLIAANSNDYQAWHLKGSELSVLGKYDDALYAFNKSISINPNNPHTWFTEGEVLFSLARYQEALDAYDEATKLNPNLPHFWSRKGDALKALGKYQEANEAYNKAYDLSSIKSVPSSGDFSANDLFSEGLKYFSVMGLTSLVVIGIVLLLEKRGKNKPKFGDDLKTKHWFGYYSVLICHIIIGAILALISLEIAFKELPLNFDTQKFFFAIPFFYLSVSSFILIVGLLALKPIIKLNTIHFLVSLIIGILLIIALADPKTPVFLPFLPLISSGISVWYDRIAIFRPGSVKESLSVGKDTEKSIEEPLAPVKFNSSSSITGQVQNNKASQKDIDIHSVFGYKGATILYKVKVENAISAPIADIKVSLFVPDVFLLLEKEKSLALLKPSENKTVTFEIRPTGECGDCEVSGKVTYYDMGTNRTKESDIGGKMLSIVCPMLKVKEISEAEWHNIVSNLLETEESTKEIEMPAESLFAMTSRIIKDMHMHALMPELTQTQQLFNGVARFYGEGVKGLKYAAQIEVVGRTRKSKLILKAWAEKEDSLTGFYHGLLDSINTRIDIKDYVDEPINNFYVHIGHNIGAGGKVIDTGDKKIDASGLKEGLSEIGHTIGNEGKVIDIGDKAINTERKKFQEKTLESANIRKCQSCGKAVQGKEKFCLSCGMRL